MIAPTLPPRNPVKSQLPVDASAVYPPFQFSAQAWEVRFDHAPSAIQFTYPDRQQYLGWERDHFQALLT